MKNQQEQLSAEIVSGETEIPKYAFATEAYLNPQGVNVPKETSPENKIESFAASTQYQEMIGDVFTEKVLRPNMTNDELDKLAAEMIAEYEAPRAEKAEQEDVAFMGRETETNRQEMTTGTENEISPISRAIGLISEYLSKHKKVAQAAMGLALASELAGCATGGGGYYAGQTISTGLYGTQQEMQTLAYGRQHQRRTEAYGIQHANSQARYAVSHAQNQYRQNMTAENFHYQQSIMRPLSPRQKQDIGVRHRANIMDIKAQHDQEIIEAQQTYNDNMEQTRIQSEDIMRDTEIQRQNIQMDTQTQITNQILEGIINGMIRHRHR